MISTNATYTPVCFSDGVVLPCFTAEVPWEGEALQNAVLLVDKPFRWTSFDVVKKLKISLGLNKVGHAGTLDPLATGLLLLCTGRATRCVAHFCNLPKGYEGELILGKTTPSFDLETPFDSECAYDHVDRTKLDAVAARFVGAIQQVPPSYSAVKQGGKRAYAQARKGKPLILMPRTVHIAAFTLTAVQLPCVRFRVVCSKGTYIRSLVHDFGQALGTGAYLSALRRTKIGIYHVKSAKILT